MSLAHMKTRMNITGNSARQEMLNNAKNIDLSENEDDLSYSSTMFKVINHNDYTDEESYIQIHPRIYNRRWNSYKNRQMDMKTTFLEPVYYGDMFFDKEDKTYWLCVESNCEDGVNYITSLLQCNYHMYWQRENYEIVSRWCTVFNASSYSNGESGEYALILQANQYMAYIPYDDITDELDNNTRLQIGNSLRRCKSYDVTRVDNVSYGGFNNSILNIIFTQSQVSSVDDKIVEAPDGNKVWICDYKVKEETPSPSPASVSTLYGEISYKGNNVITAGRNSKIFTFIPKDSSGNVITTTEFSWGNDIDSSYSDFIHIITNSTKCEISVDYDADIIGYTFKLSVLDKNNVAVDLVEIEIGG